MFLMSEVDLCQEKFKRPETEPQKNLPARGDPEGHQSKATRFPLVTEPRLTMGLPAVARPGHSLAEAESWQRPQTGRLYEDPEDTERAVAHRSWGMTLAKLRNQITGSRSCRFQQTATRNHPSGQMPSSQRSKGRQDPLPKDPTSFPPPLGHEASPSSL